MKSYKDFKKEDLEDFLDELLDSRVEKERKIVAYTGCKTYGVINIMETHCNDPECKSCSTFVNAIKEEIKGWKD